jgi:Fungal specific transcription factor domain
MVTGHSWGAGEARQAWIYLGMAVRMAQILGLFEEPPPSTSRKEFIDAEERRRTAWTCFLMDSLLSGGKRRVRALSVPDMRVQLPCDTDYFHFGEIVRCETMDGSLPKGPPLSIIGNLGIVAYSMRAADIWGQVAKWACSTKVEGELPWEPQSEFQQLLTSLTAWELSLPSRLKFDIMSLHAHSASNQGQAYAYMHAISLMALMFLHRSYLSHSFTQNKHDTDSRLDYEWRQWQAQSRRELMNVTRKACEMFEEMRAFGLYFLRGLVPWNGYTVYTAAGIMLYFFHFPEEEDDDEVLRQCRDRVVKGCEFLRDMKNSWPMADSWVRIFPFTCLDDANNNIARNSQKDADFLHQHQH